MVKTHLEEFLASNSCRLETNQWLVTMVTSLVTSRVTNNEVTNLLTNHKYSKLSIFKHKKWLVSRLVTALLVTWLVTRRSNMDTN